jgi:hypothetical protein
LVVGVAAGGAWRVHRHLAEHCLLSFLSLLGAFRLRVIKRNQA